MATEDVFKNRKVGFMTAVTVIIPTFNSEKFLPGLFHDLAELVDCEVIFVDDGSVDKTVPMIQKFIYATKNDVKVLCQNHRGPSVARNKGIIEATANYIVFVDSDDRIDSASFIRLTQENHKSDVVYIGQNNINVISDKLDPIRDNLAYSLLRLDTSVFSSKFGFSVLPGPWSKMYSRNFLLENKISFPEDVLLGEDMLFNLDVVFKAKTFSASNISFYKMRRRIDSLSTAYDFDIANNCLAFLRSLQHIVPENIFKRQVPRSVVRNVERSIRNNHQRSEQKRMAKLPKSFGVNLVGLGFKKTIVFVLIELRLFGLVSVIMRIFEKEHTRTYGDVFFEEL
ncbi:glycosyltransferase family 2 protein [Lacticaseibacillus pantheris]|uniref:glycosyltransferase family 2 protein n=1 Tax=Lacticaseibacillus pantheris TaxID=171523 RepID=UPI00265ACB7D|nr:glycosyltransferase [Lacticaseibacillus pantheris]WKF84156.1 glycosyltransferase [Lacticaseibacillus pantheris]